MNQIITKYQLKLFPVIVSMLLLVVTFKIDLIKSDTMGLYMFKIISVPLLSIVSLVIAFGKSGLSDIFSRPIKPFKNIVKWYVISLMTSFISGVILTVVFKLNLHGNPGLSNVVQTLISLPFLLLFEEIISIFVLLVVSNFIYKKTSNLNLSQIVGTLLSAILFGLLHYSTYFNGDVIHTIIHIIFVQGLVRIFLNFSALKSNSIIVPWFVHLIFDFTTFGLGSVMLISLM